MKPLRLLLLFMLFLDLAACGDLFPGKPKAYITQKNGTVSVVDLSAKQILTTLNVGASPQGICISPDGMRAYVANTGSDTVSVLDTQKDEITGTFNAAHAPVACAIAPDGKHLYVASVGGISGNNGNTVYAIDTGTGKARWTIDTILGPAAVAVSKDGRMVYVTSRMEHALFQISAETGEILLHKKLGPSPDGVVVSPDGTKVYVAFHIFGGFINGYNVNDWSELGRIPVGEGPRGIDISPDGRLLCVANQGTKDSSNTVTFISTEEYKVIKTVEVGPGIPDPVAARESESAVTTTGPVGISFGPDGQTVYVTCEYSNTLVAIDVNKLEVVAQIAVGQRPYSFGRFIVPPPRNKDATPVKQP